MARPRPRLSRLSRPDSLEDSHGTARRATRRSNAMAISTAKSQGYLAQKMEQGMSFLNVEDDYLRMLVSLGPLLELAPVLAIHMQRH